MKVSARVDNDGGAPAQMGASCCAWPWRPVTATTSTVRRRSGGIEENPASAINAEVVEGLLPGDAEVQFRTPYEMYDPGALRQSLDEAGTQLLSGRTSIRTAIQCHAAEMRRASIRSCM